MSDILVEQAAPLTACVQTLPVKPLEEGQVRLHVVKLALTANTVTYAIAGAHPMLQYFAHWPVPEDFPDAAKYARCPVWGTAVVIESKCAEVKEGTRVHGFLAFSKTVVVTPTKVTSTDFVDAAPHREGLIEVYKKFTLHQGSSFEGSADEEDWQTSVGMLFVTGFGMAHGACVHAAKPTAVVFTSASSKTSMGGAFAARMEMDERKAAGQETMEIVGLTSAGNVDFVRGLGLYDVVCVYEEVAALKKQKVAVYDLSGNASLQEAIYRHYSDDMVSYHMVGFTHAQEGGKTAALEGLGGPKPEMFLVFTALDEVGAAYGKSEMQAKMGAATAAYKARMLPAFKPVRVYGPEAALGLWADMSQARCKAECSYGCSLWSEEMSEPKVAPA